MEPISNSDRLVLLLRNKLEERAKAASSGRSAAKLSGGVPVSPMGVHALAAIDWADERLLRRSIVQYLLADQLGPTLINDAQFQQIVSRVTDAIEEDAQASNLLTQAISELRPV